MHPPLLNTHAQPVLTCSFHPLSMYGLSEAAHFRRRPHTHTIHSAHHTGSITATHLTPFAGCSQRAVSTGRSSSLRQRCRMSCHGRQFDACCTVIPLARIPLVTASAAQRLARPRRHPPHAAVRGRVTPQIRQIPAHAVGGEKCGARQRGTLLVAAGARRVTTVTRPRLSRRESQPAGRGKWRT